MHQSLDPIKGSANGKGVFMKLHQQEVQLDSDVFSIIEIDGGLTYTLPGLERPKGIGDAYVPKGEKAIRESLAMPIFQNFAYILREQYIGFSGRASRNEYIKYQVVCFFIFWLLQVLIASITAYDMPAGASLYAYYGTSNMLFLLFMGLYAFAFFLPTLSIQARRLHDVGWSHWWLLLHLVPPLALLGQFVLCFPRGKIKENRYGVPVHYYVLTKQEVKMTSFPDNREVRQNWICFWLILGTMYAYMGVEKFFWPEL